VKLLVKPLVKLYQTDTGQMDERLHRLPDMNFFWLCVREGGMQAVLDGSFALCSKEKSEENGRMPRKTRPVKI
jgi:hypothetical protein